MRFWSFPGKSPVRFVDALRYDVRDALRALRCSRAYSAWVVGSLAIGMAVTIAGLALLNATMVLPFPEITEQKRLVRLAVSRNCGRPDCWIRLSSPAVYDALRAQLPGLEAVAAYTFGELPVALPEARSMRGALVSANYFDVLGVRPVLGRAFDDADAKANAGVAVISHAVWAREFGADPSVIGRSIRVANRFVHIVGVAPALFIGVNRVNPGDRAPELWVPLWLADDLLPLTAAERRRQQRDLAFVGRMRDGVDVPQVHAQAAVVAERLAAGSPGMAEVRRVWKVDPKSWQYGVMVVMPIPILVLAIACVNAANLMLARGSGRQRDIAVRLAIGAARARIVRQLLIESAVLALVATAAAVPIAWWALRVASAPLGTPIPFDPAVLALTILTAVATTLAFGLAPAIRVSAQRPSTTLGSSGASTDALPHQSRMRRLLVVAQVALSLGLLATAWQLVSTVRAQAVSGGTPADRLLIVRFDLQPFALETSETDGFYNTLLARTSRLPGVEAAGLARHTSVWTFGQRAAAASIVVWHQDDGPDDGRTTAGGYAGGDLFDAAGLRVLAGRAFTEADRAPRPQTAVVNRTFAQTFDGASDPGAMERAVGRVIRVAPHGRNYASAIDVRIVGVIEAAHEPRLEAGGAPAAKVYLASPIEPEPALTLYLHTREPATSMAQQVRELVSDIAPRVPILELGSLEELNERSYAMQLWLARAAAFVGVIGLLLATAGLYGVSSYVVAMRSREIAIRMAVGARPRAILQMILGDSMRVAVAGLVFGGAAAAVASRWIQSEYHGIERIDRLAFGGAAALFVAAMLFASAVPAVRASRVDPAETLKDA